MQIFVVVYRVVVAEFLHRSDVTSWLFASLTFTERLFNSNYHALIIFSSFSFGDLFVRHESKINSCTRVTLLEHSTTQQVIYPVEFSYAVSYKVGNLATIKSPYRVFSKLSHAIKSSGIHQQANLYRIAVLITLLLLIQLQTS